MLEKGSTVKVSKKFDDRYDPHPGQETDRQGSIVGPGSIRFITVQAEGPLRHLAGTYIIHDSHMVRFADGTIEEVDRLWLEPVNDIERALWRSAMRMVDLDCTWLILLASRREDRREAA